MKQTEMIAKIRAKVVDARSDLYEKLISNKIAWSKTSSERSWFARWLHNLPSKPFTRDEAIHDLSCYTVGEIIEDPEFYSVKVLGNRVIEICDALENAEKAGITLCITIDDLSEINDWLE